VLTEVIHAIEDTDGEKASNRLRACDWKKKQPEASIGSGYWPELFSERDKWMGRWSSFPFTPVSLFKARCRSFLIEKEGGPSLSPKVQFGITIRKTKDLIISKRGDSFPFYQNFVSQRG